MGTRWGVCVAITRRHLRIHYICEMIFSRYGNGNAISSRLDLHVCFFVFASSLTGIAQLF